MKANIKIPRRFFNDHAERVDHAPIPEIARQTQAHYFIDANDPGVFDLLSDAEYYAELSIHDSEAYLFGIIRSAVATVKALKAQLPENILKTYADDWSKNPKYCYYQPEEVSA